MTLNTKPFSTELTDGREANVSSKSDLCRTKAAPTHGQESGQPLDALRALIAERIIPSLRKTSVRPCGSVWQPAFGSWSLPGFWKLCGTSAASKSFARGGGMERWRS